VGYDWKSELLFTFELGNDNRLWPLASETIGVWFVDGLPWEVGAAGGFASMFGNDDLWQYVVFVVSLRKFFSFPLC